MLSYNHAAYIRDALNAILNQRTDFGFEILVHDDASQDGSAEIIREYAALYPSIVKPIIQTVNQYSQGIAPSVHFNYPRALLPFVAICEADDYWTDDLKLQLQVDGLVAHPELNFCFHKAIRIHCLEPAAPPLIIGDYGLTDGIVPVNDVLFRTRGWIPYASCLFRQDAKGRFLEFIRSRAYLTIGDLYFQFFGAEPNGALYLARPMSVYRFGTVGSWSRDISGNLDQKIRHEMAMMRSYVELDGLTEGRYHEQFIALVLQRLIWLFKAVQAKDHGLLRSSDGRHSDFDRRLGGLHAIYQECQSAISLKLQNWKQSAREFVVFGCGSGCELILEGIGTERVRAIIDRDRRRVGESLSGIPIIQLDQLVAYPDVDLLVSTLSSRRDEIEAMGNAAGLSEDRIHYLFESAVDHLNSHPIAPYLLVD